jgi:hypothetical protein
MKFNCVDVGFETISFFEKEKCTSFEMVNTILKDRTGIVDFFEKEKDFVQLQQTLKTRQNIVAESRVEYGDFQTNMQLANSVCNYLYSKNITPKILLEPTCGKGSFIISAIKIFDSLQQIFGIEIQEKYLWHLKFELLEYFLKNPTEYKPEINLYHCSVFDFDFTQIKRQINNRELLVIGNPPWVTNSTLSTLNSKNLPQKSNFKNTKGIDAITGKGNFDIGEFISLKMLDLFSGENGHFAFLIKNSVIKNIIFEQKKKRYPIAGIEKHTINAKKEFDAAVDASVFVCKFNSTSEFIAKEFDFYTLKPQVSLGWVNNKFASDIEKYKKYQHLDGICPFEWRQGIKHDCAKVMELERINGGFRNALGEEFELEEDLIYGILKSSDLKGDIVNNSRKFTIVTQKRIGEDTSWTLEQLPKTRAYLHRHKEHFLNRKSSIYNGKPMFSIFGVGDYSFKSYKVAISGLYKQKRFTLVKPNGKVLLLDDTCYFIGFDTIEEAQDIQNFLNQFETQEFIESFMFIDAKRVITKELLMRINFTNHPVYRRRKQLTLFD